MEFIRTSQSAMDKMRKAAKQIKTADLPHRRTLDLVAQQHGYSGWKHATTCHSTTIKLAQAQPSH